MKVKGKGILFNVGGQTGKDCLRPFFYWPTVRESIKERSQCMAQSCLLARWIVIIWLAAEK